MEKYVPRPKFEEMTDKISCSEISNKGCSAGSVYFNNEQYVITGAVSTGAGGTSAIWGNKIVPLEIYLGELKPLLYSEHNNEVDEGKRERGYDGMLIVNEGRKVVMTGPRITFRPIETEIQLTLY